MKADYLSYARATSVSLLGLVIQVVLGVGLLIYSVLGRDHAAQSGAYAILLGAIVWIVLAVVYDQHRRERIEALEQEQLDAAKEGSVFSASTEDLRVNARRLAWMHSFLVPGVSILLAGLLIALAYWRITDAMGRIGYDKAGVDLFTKPPHRGWAIAIGLGLGIVGFIFARFVSGMSKQKMWANLRGGAGYAVLASLIGIAIAIAHFVDMASRDDALRYIQIIIPALAGFLGVEIVVSLLLNLYRPRKPGEIPRSAFDSPILGFAASPDRIAKTLGGAISYQVGVDVTGTWAYKLVARAVLPLLLLGAAVMWIMTCVTVVGPTERGIRVRNGLAVENVGPGLHFKLPWPFESIDRMNASLLQEVELATPAAGNEIRALLWTNDHKVKETYALVRTQPRASRMGVEPAHDASHDSTQTLEIALVAVRVPLRYRVSDIEKFERFNAPATRIDALTALARRELMLELARYTDDEVIGPRRAEAGEAVLQRVQKAFADADTGVEVLFAGIETVHPQREVAREFEKIVAAGRVRESLVDGGRTDAIGSLTRAVGDLALARTIVEELEARKQMQNAAADAKAVAEQTTKIETLILRAGGRAGATLAQARADRWNKHMTQRGQAMAYEGRLAAFRANPSLYKATLYLAMLRDELAHARVYLVPDGADVRVRINAEDQGSGGNIFSTGAAETGNK
ncbi:MULTISPECIES: SPFH domain-containing protein [unclassified Nostoc]|uniref:SPFH domain-containing protein n=1 Tax=unclassified Nostoc TaxID=2593658 RepID=UPI001E5CCCDB|nr:MULTISPECIES: SPFH domain-containing protein [unclassified Nostoc]MCC5618902.1 hypothetical protein [Nostoc sp. CHAB 5836]MCC5621594.1 hypothetical protein [Nostoc sp. CHAB 5715]